MWVNIYSVNMTWYKRIWINVRWRVSGLFRKGLTPAGIVAWYKLNLKYRRLNKALLAEAKSLRNEPKYPAPTPEEIEDFIEWSEAHYGIKIE